MRFWFGADYLLWFPEGQNLPPGLVSTGLFGSGTDLLGTEVNYSASHGFRIDTGLWTDGHEDFGIQFLFSYLFRNETTLTVGPPGFINAEQPNGGAVSYTLNAPGMQLDTWTELANLELNLLGLRYSGNADWYLLVGPRFLRLEEDIIFNYAAGGAGNFRDEFHAENRFYGAQIGLVVKRTSGAWGADAAIKCGIGVNDSSVTVNGANDATLALPFTTGHTQIFTNEANIGRHEDSSFSVVPEVNLNLTYQWSDRWELRTGYTFLAITGVARPGDQVNPTLDFTAPHSEPTLPYALSTFTVHGLNFGANYRF